MSIIDSNAVQKLKVIYLMSERKCNKLIFSNCISSESAAKIIGDTGNVPLTKF